MDGDAQLLGLSRADVGEEPWLPPEDLLLKPGFISEAERIALRDWAREMRPHLNANGPGRTFSKVQDLPTLHPIHTVVRLRLQELLGVGADAEPEPMFGWYLSVISRGAAVHPHIDPAPEDMRHLRCNVFLQLPPGGGMPIIERRPVPVEERTLLAFYPSERRHSSQPVQGALRRIILSFGYLVPRSYRLPV